MGGITRVTRELCGRAIHTATIVIGRAVQAIAPLTRRAGQTHIHLALMVNTPIMEMAIMEMSTTEIPQWAVSTHC